MDDAQDNAVDSTPDEGAVDSTGDNTVDSMADTMAVSDTEEGAPGLARARDTGSATDRSLPDMVQACIPHPHRETF